MGKELYNTLMQVEAQDPNKQSANAEQEPGGWDFNEDEQVGFAPDAIDPVQWSASEFIAHEKSTLWYLALTGGTITLALIAYVLSKEFLTPSLLIITGLLFGYMAARKPRELVYVIDEKGVYIGNKFFSYSDFRSFSVVQEGAVESIWFMPMKRLSPSITIYFAPQDGDKIVNALANFLPVEEKELEAIDKLMHRIGF